MTCVLKEARRIKDRLRACQSAEEVEAVADEERETVYGMQGDKGDGDSMFHQIAFLKAYLINHHHPQTQRRSA